MDNTPHKSGFIAVIGRPNVGKSTLINQLIGQKIAIMSDKPQTTRSRILCVLTQPDAQIVLLDTPGVHKPLSKLGEYMDRSITNTLKEVDAVFFVVDATEKPGPGERFIMERLDKTKKPVILVLNKIDLVTKDALLPIIAAYSKDKEFAAVVPISALGEENLDALLSEAQAKMITAGTYNSTVWPTTASGIERDRQKALNDLKDEMVTLKVDVYGKIASVTADIGKQLLDCEIRIIEAMQKMLVGPTELRNTVFKWMLDFMERRDDDHPSLESLVTVSEKLGYAEGAPAANISQ